MALNGSPEFKGVEIQSLIVRVRWSLTNTCITSGNIYYAEFHASEANGSEEYFNIFLCISILDPGATI